MAQTRFTCALTRAGLSLLAATHSSDWPTRRRLDALIVLCQGGSSPSRAGSAARGLAAVSWASSVSAWVRASASPSRPRGYQ
jgi:hypothetical protein